MSSGSRSSTAVDAGSPVRASYINLYKSPESDNDFVRSVAGEGRAHPSNRKLVPGTSSVWDSYSCPQMYLRSYVFTRKKETVPDRARRHLRKIKERIRDVENELGNHFWINEKGYGTVIARKLKSIVGHLFSGATSRLSKSG